MTDTAERCPHCLGRNCTRPVDFATHDIRCQKCREYGPLCPQHGTGKPARLVIARINRIDGRVYVLGWEDDGGAIAAVDHPMYYYPTYRAAARAGRERFNRRGPLRVDH